MKLWNYINLFLNNLTTRKIILKYFSFVAQVLYLTVRCNNQKRNMTVSKKYIF